MDAKTSMSSHLTLLFVSAAGITCSVLALAMYHCILLKYFSRPQRTQRRNNNNRNISVIKNNHDGVQEEILNKIPIFSISTQTTRDTIHLDQNECTICLGQWEDGDVVRLLPSCNHVFHRPCIDAWFMNHANCPVCRSPITCDCELALPIENVDKEQSVLHVHGNTLCDHPHYSFMNDDVSGSTPRFQRSRPMLLHTHSLSSHMWKKPRGLVMGLKRSLSLDQTSSYIGISIQRDHGDASTSSNSSTKGTIMSQYNYTSRSRLHLDHMSSVLMKSFSQFRDTSTESGRYNAILPN